MTNTNTSFVKRHALALFFVLVYGISWGTFFIMGGPFVFPLGALLAAFIMAGLTGGLKDLLSRMFRWRVGIQWYAAALLVGPAIALVALYLNVLLGAPVPTAAQLGPWYGLFLLFPGALLDAPFWEETGWRGFALPRFATNRSPLFNTLILALLVTGWHLPIALSERAITAPYLIGAFSSAFVTNWVYYNTRGSALLPMLYHTAANTVGPYFFSMFAGLEQARYFWLLSGMTLVAGIVVVLVTGPALQHQPRRPAEPAPAL
ncbi:MAG TPA: CPBP family intramembrane glutamic endopeptidase [Anaerolineales bacterium]